MTEEEKKICEELRKAESEEFVRVVRCEDCKWNSGSEHNPWCQRFNMPFDAGWFCADGERI